MKTAFIKTVPQGNFVEISVLMNDWQARLQSLLAEKRSIKFDLFPQPQALEEFQKRLDQYGYRDLAIDNDRWQHFLMPESN